MKKTNKKSKKSTTKRTGITKKATVKKKMTEAKKPGRKKTVTPRVKKIVKKKTVKSIVKKVKNKRQSQQKKQKVSTAKSKKKSPALKSRKTKQVSRAKTNKDEKIATRKKGAVKDTTNQDLTLKNLVRKQKQTPAVFKLPTRKHTPIVFSLEEVRDVLKHRQSEIEATSKNKRGKSTLVKTKEILKRKTESKISKKTKRRKLGAASLADILGFTPSDKGANPTNDQHDSKKVPEKFQKYYNMLIDLRNHVKSGLDLHTQDTLKRSSKDDTGDLSSYSQHMADAGTDNFDRDFALSLVSNEQDALSEIEAAIERIFNGTYGICEITGQQIKRERLIAVPFTRFSVQGQVEYESTNRKSVQRGGLFIDSNVENSAQFTNDSEE